MCREKLAQAGNCRIIRGFKYLAEVIKGVPFKDGIEVKKSDQMPCCPPLD